jgi:hypothetical protein
LLTNDVGSFVFLDNENFYKFVSGKQDEVSKIAELKEK